MQIKRAHTHTNEIIIQRAMYLLDVGILHTIYFYNSDALLLANAQKCCDFQSATKPEIFNPTFNYKFIYVFAVAAVDLARMT